MQKRLTSKTVAYAPGGRTRLGPEFIVENMLGNLVELRCTAMKAG